MYIHAVENNENYIEEQWTSSHQCDSYVLFVFIICLLSKTQIKVVYVISYQYRMENLKFDNKYKSTDITHKPLGFLYN